MIIKFLLLTVITPEYFGLFSATLLYSSIPSMVASALNLSWAPLFFANAQKWVDNAIYYDYVKISTSLIAIISCFLLVFWQELLPIYFGFLPKISTIFVALLCISSWMASIVWTGFTNPIFEKGLTKTLMNIAIKALIILTPFAYYLIINFDLLGTSISLLSYSILICYFSSMRLKKLNYVQIPFIEIIRVFMLMIVVIILLHFEMNYFGDSSILRKISIFSIFLFLILFPIYKTIPILIRKIDTNV
jgi:O-antigen/teichoic acid export membrane protein